MWRANQINICIKRKKYNGMKEKDEEKGTTRLTPPLPIAADTLGQDRSADFI